MGYNALVLQISMEAADMLLVDPATVVIALPTEASIRRRLEGKGITERLMWRLLLKLANKTMLAVEVARVVHWCVATQPMGSVTAEMERQIIAAMIVTDELREEALAELEWLQRRLLDDFLSTGRVDVCKLISLGES